MVDVKGACHWTSNRMLYLSLFCTPKQVRAKEKWHYIIVGHSIHATPSSSAPLVVIRLSLRHSRNVHSRKNHFLKLLALNNIFQCEKMEEKYFYGTLTYLSRVHSNRALRRIKRCEFTEPFAKRWLSSPLLITIEMSILIVALFSHLNFSILSNSNNSKRGNKYAHTYSKSMRERDVEKKDLITASWIIQLYEHRRVKINFEIIINNFSNWFLNFFHFFSLRNLSLARSLFYVHSAGWCNAFLQKKTSLGWEIYH